MEKSPYEKVLDQIAELMQMAYDNAQKPIPPEKEKQIEAQLTDLESQVEKLKKTSDQIMEGSGLTDFTYKQFLNDPGQEISSTLSRAEELKKEAEKASLNAQEAAQEQQASGKRLNAKKKKEKSESPQTRKGKFKSMGGFKNWKPL